MLTCLEDDVSIDISLRKNNMTNGQYHDSNYVQDNLLHIHVQMVRYNLIDNLNGLMVCIMDAERRGPVSNLRSGCLAH